MLQALPIMVRGYVPSTGGERTSDTFKFKHHAIVIPQLTAADRILEAAKQLDHAITQQPKQAPMDELTAIELLREVLLGKVKNPSHKTVSSDEKLPS